MTDKERIEILLAALEEWSAPYIDYVGFIETDIVRRLNHTRAAIAKAKEGS